VWTVKVAVHVVDHDGALLDACTAAALAALLTFRHPAVSVGGDTGTEVTVVPATVKEAVKLNVHMQPLALTFAFIAHPDGEGEELLLVDPSYKEQVRASERWRATQPA
jgi:exosome complex component RRP45